ncbi:hypothetical protein ACFPFX_09190 [Streptomyces mauvecolor]|uniref:Uncharacterized protein n=1 Tax=Streptomyces mauvecolor TaxID=58345 RepID=A0ABV9UJ88_9ACTN
MNLHCNPFNETPAQSHYRGFYQGHQDAREQFAELLDKAGERKAADLVRRSALED